jgi:magnesium chelatase family protein
LRVARAVLMQRRVLARLNSSTLRGVDAISIEIEVDVSGGNLPTYHVVGMPAQSVREGAVRIRSALEAGGQEFPQRKITVNLAPADLPKIGTAFDLPIAIGILVAEGVFEMGPLEDVLMMGELGLDGTLRKVRGALAAAMLAKRMGLRGIVLPQESAGEAAVVDGIDVYAASHLAEVVGALAGVQPMRSARVTKARPAEHFGLDLSDVRGQGLARKATEVAVAGGHNLLLVGPPGIGKSMIARRVPTILPPLSSEEAIEITKVYSAAGLSEGLASERPFRAPHHTISTGALLGGGPLPRPGEITLAHNGVLFLDELPEFQRNAIEALRQPLEDREVMISRVNSTVRLPASFLLVASANPCPCGWVGSGVRQCVCTGSLVERYRNRLSGPLLDRIDLHVTVKPVSLKQLRHMEPGESSATVRARIVEARERQATRLAPFGLRTNAEMTPAVTRATCNLTPGAETHLASLVDRTAGISARAIDRIIKVARTNADLQGRDIIVDEDIGLAAGYRVLDCDPTVDPRGFRTVTSRQSPAN